VQLFDRTPEVLAKYRQMFKHILVDEYQDINHSQYGWVRRLVNDAENLTVWETMTRAFTSSAERTYAIFWNSNGIFPGPASLNWSKTTVPPRRF